MTSLPLFRLSTILCLGAATALQAGESVTDPLGGVSYNFPPQSQTSLGVPILRPPLRIDVLTNGILTAATLTNATNLAQDIPAGSRCYLEIIGPSSAGSNAPIGARFEIDVSTTRLMANNIVSINPASALTTPGTNLADCVGCRVAIRPHWTLATLFGTGSAAPGLQGSTTIKTADQVHFWTGQGVSVFWFRSNAAGTSKQWRNAATGAIVQDDTVIPPGVGVIFQRSGATPFSLAAYGDVRTNAFVQRVGTGKNLLAAGFPRDMSPALSGYGATAGFSASASPATADQIVTGLGSSESTYWFAQDSGSPVKTWRNTATGTTDQTTTAFLHPLRAYFTRTSANAGPVVVIRPFDN